MSEMFYGNIGFDQSLNSWNVSKVTDMNSMFYFLIYYNQPLDSWNVSKVTDMEGMFYGDTNFNQPLSSWNVSKVIEMGNMFAEATNFNQPLNSWDVYQVTDMNSMFYNATNFDQPLNSWNISKVTDMNHMFTHISLSISNYNKLLLAWSSLPNLEHNVVFDAGNSQYTTSAQSAREKLTDNFGWNITDGGIILTKTSSFTTLELEGLLFILSTVAIGILGYLLITLFEYKKTKHTKQVKNLKFLIYLKNKFRSKKDIKFSQTSLSNETFSKLEHIIEENKKK